jgi:XTP/dITP diphosphohydrolase
MSEDRRLAAFQRLLDIMDELRQKCPWDSQQTFESLRYLTIEETYELSDAIIDKKYEDVGKELGDLMLHIVFYAKLGAEANLFDIADVLNGICNKLIVRHPHVFGEVEAANAEAVRNNWEKIKLKEGNKSVLGGVPVSLPAMIKAYRIQEKAHGVGFDWNNRAQVWQKVQEELQEFMVEDEARSEKMEEEFGDLLFALVNYARFVHLNPEDALERANRKFMERFQFIEKNVKDENRNWSDMSLEEMELLWQQAKKKE